MDFSHQHVGVTVIGRNEGERLRASLSSLRGVEHIAYVDSGSTDGSQLLAKSMGVTLIEIAVPPIFTAARARNLGWKHLIAKNPKIKYVQMVDGDCTIDPNWISLGVKALEGDEGLAGVFGRLREAHPNRSIYNQLCDIEWNVAAGPVYSTGGNALFRVEALQQVGGYADDLAAGEEPDMCLRMALTGGWRFLSVPAPMGQHDAAISSFAQWWKRSSRAGYAVAEHVARHGANSLRGDVAQMRRIFVWAFFLPTMIGLAFLAMTIYRGAALAGGALLLIYPLQALRLAWLERGLAGSPSRRVAIGVLKVTHQFAAARGFVARKFRIEK